MLLSVALRIDYDETTIAAVSVDERNLDSDEIERLAEYIKGEIVKELTEWNDELMNGK